jgi:hypothetical protein
MDYRPHCSGFPVQYGASHPGPKLQLPLGLTIAALVGLWPSNIARFPNPSTIPLDTLHGLSPPLFWIPAQYGDYHPGPQLQLPLGLTIAALVGFWPSNIARFPNLSTIPLDTLHGLPPPLFWIPAQYGDYHPGPKLQLPLGLTIAALVGLWPSNIARFPNLSTIPLDTLHGLYLLCVYLLDLLYGWLTQPLPPSPGLPIRSI